MTAPLRVLAPLLLAGAAVFETACTPPSPPAAAAAPSSSNASAAAYFDNEGRDDVLSGGVKMIPIATPKGTFHVWTKRVGNNPKVKVLLLHGGPAADHEYMEAFDSYFPKAGIEFYYYDQLGSFFSDQPNEPSLWELPRFVEEVEQVRVALGHDQHRRARLVRLGRLAAAAHPVADLQPIGGFRPDQALAPRADRDHEGRPSIPDPRPPH